MMMDHDYAKKVVANKSRNTKYCCVPQCGTYGETGISFHLFPKDIIMKKKWEITLRMGKPISPAMRVCSRHFQASDYFPNNSIRHKLFPDAVPSQNIPKRSYNNEKVPLSKKIQTIVRKNKNDNRHKKIVASKQNLGPVIENEKIDVEDGFEMALNNQAEIKVCRVCLAIDVKMCDMKDFKLSDMFTNVTGIAVCDETEGKLHRVCWDCAARLAAASAFKDQALLSNTLLKDLAHINKREIEQFKQYNSHLKSTLTIQKFPSVGIECGDSPKELHSKTKKNERNVHKRQTRCKNNIEEEITVFHEEEPLIGIPVKTEIEFDPIAETVQVKHEKIETYIELTNLDDSFTPSKEDSEIRNTVERIDNNEKNEDEMSNAPIKFEIDSADDSTKDQPKLDVVEHIFAEPPSEDTEMTVEQDDDSDHFLAEDNVQDNPTPDDISESSSEEDTQSLVELISVKKAKK